MIALLLLALIPRDEVTDLIAKIRAAPENEQFRIAVQLPAVVKPAHLPLLVKETDAGPATLRPHFIRAIGRIGGREACTVLRGLIQRNDLASRAEAAGQLKLLQDETGVKALLELLPKAATVQEKYAVLGHLYGGSPSDSAGVVPALLKFLEKETVDSVRGQAIRLLCTYKDAAVAPVIRRIAQDPKDPNRYDALSELIRRGDDTALEDAMKTLEEQKLDSNGTIYLLSAIEQSNKRSVLPRLRAVLEKTQDRNTKLILIRSLATMKDDKALPLISRFTEDPDPAIAKVATESVVRLSGRAQAETLKKAADDADPLNRLDAAEALLQIDSPEGWTALKSVLEEGNATVKYRALTVLSNQRRREAVDLLVLLLDDPVENLRNIARASLASTLAALYPYQKFDPQAPADKLKAWWEKNRGR